MDAPTLRLHAIELFERPVTLRLPFKFGAATVTECPQAFVRVRISLAAASPQGIIETFEGASAELMVPKWFDKSPELTQSENFDQLRLATQLARAAYLEAAPAGGAGRNAFALSEIAGQSAIFLALAQGLPRLAAQFGPALIDKAIADALLRALKVSWMQGLQTGVFGDPYTAGLALKSPSKIFLRHTVGMLDRLVASDPGPAPEDGLPATLEAAIERYGLRYFKLKLCGRFDEDLDRLTRIASVLDKLPDYQVTLDGNETFNAVDELNAYWQKLEKARAGSTLLARLLGQTLLLEQPLHRSIALQQSIRQAGISVPVILDESDDHPDVLNRGLTLGYGGISSKACKGIYRSMRSAFLIQQRRDLAPGLLLSGEDLTCQAGLAVQQDTFLAASLGVTHIERNGHHYVDGFGAAPEQEALAFAKAHPSLYEVKPGKRMRPHLRIRDGQLDLQSLYVPGFASKSFPSWESLLPMPTFPTRTV